MNIGKNGLGLVCWCTQMFPLTLYIKNKICRSYLQNNITFLYTYISTRVYYQRRYLSIERLSIVTSVYTYIRYIDNELFFII